MRLTGTFVFCLLAFPLVAQTKNLTLQQTKQIAIERNLQVLQAQNNIDAAQAQVLAASGSYLPTISASGSWSRNQSDRAAITTQVISGLPITSPASFSVTNNFNLGVNASLTVFDGLAKQARVSAASSSSIATEKDAIRTRQQVVFQVVASYITVFRNKYLVTVSEENLKRDLRQLERITESNRVGALSLADVYRQQSQVAADEFDLITQQNNYDKSRADLVALIGLDAMEDYTFDDPSIPTNIDSLEMVQSSTRMNDLPDLTKRALIARPDYQSAKQSVDVAAASVTIARSTYFPSASLFGGYTLQNEEFNKVKDNKNLNWGLSLRWTLFDGFQTNQQIQSATVSRRNAEAALAQTERTISVDVKKALLDLDASRKAYESSQKGLVSAQEDRKIAEERYNLGAGTLLDLLTANANLVRAQSNLANAVTGYLVSKYNLEYALGEKSY